MTRFSVATHRPNLTVFKGPFSFPNLSDLFQRHKILTELNNSFKVRSIFPILIFYEFHCQKHRPIQRVFLNLFQFSQSFWPASASQNIDRNSTVVLKSFQFSQSIWLVSATNPENSFIIVLVFTIPLTRFSIKKHVLSSTVDLKSFPLSQSSWSVSTSEIWIHSESSFKFFDPFHRQKSVPIQKVLLSFLTPFSVRNMDPFRKFL